jgi:hypothetical protein
MAMIHVARAGATLGEFSVEEVQEGLRIGRFLSSDLGWQTGMTEWRPLPELAGPLPAASTASPQTQPAAPPVAQPAALPVTSTSAPTYETVPQGGLPWERRRELGLFKAFFDTVVLIVTKPYDAFAMMKPDGGMGEPLLFAVVGAGFGMIVSMLFQIALQTVGLMFSGRAQGLSGIACGFLVIPFAVALGVFIISGLIHLCLMMLGGAKKPFETTFRVVCFSTGTAHLIAVVPFIGTYIAMVYNMVLQIIGIMRAHPTDAGRAAGAVLLPIVVCCGGGALLAFLTVGAGFLSLLGR